MLKSRFALFNRREVSLTGGRDRSLLYAKPAADLRFRLMCLRAAESGDYITLINSTQDGTSTRMLQNWIAEGTGGLDIAFSSLSPHPQAGVFGKLLDFP